MNNTPIEVRAVATSSPLLDQSPTSGLKNLRADLYDELPGCGNYTADRASAASDAMLVTVIGAPMFSNTLISFEPNEG